MLSNVRNQIGITDIVVSFVIMNICSFLIYGFLPSILLVLCSISGLSLVNSIFCGIEKITGQSHQKRMMVRVVRRQVMPIVAAFFWIYSSKIYRISFIPHNIPITATILPFMWCFYTYYALYMLHKVIDLVWFYRKYGENVADMEKVL